jgi:hypothetical protein
MAHEALCGSWAVFSGCAPLYGVTVFSVFSPGVRTHPIIRSRNIFSCPVFGFRPHVPKIKILRQSVYGMKSFYLAARQLIVINVFCRITLHCSFLTKSF